MKKVWLVIVILIIVLVLGITLKDKNTKPKEIVLGAPLSLTGFASTDGLSIKHAIDLAVLDLAKQGIKVRVIYEDDGTDAKKTILAVQKLVSVEKVDALVGPTWSFLLDAAGPVIGQYKVVSYSPANTSEFISAENPYLFFGAIKNEKRTDPTAKWLQNMKAKRVAILVSKDAWGASNLEPLQKAVVQAGAKTIIVETLPFNSEATIMPTIVSKIKNSKVDALLWTGYDEGGTILIKKLQEQKVGIPVLAASTALSRLAKNGNVTVRPTDQFYYLTTNIAEEFAEKYYNHYGEYPWTYADSAYDGVMLLVEAIQNKSANQTLEDYLRTKTNYRGYQTTYSFDENGDIKEGQWIVKKVE